uniref:Nuclear speckle splicing regulatory protein 1 N-terminal domain-containing protein n=1 Tax=Alexandrium monilatum TaxID=311494 RepID=A0A7S4Q1V6_9DINO|mmetsp:Transcript_83556/g.263851  ORF Transcript_83556/g.263851 Transcript_83556/m.263851 type:complete len:348 (-) Transcript_83556:192-1235(-)
MKSGPDKTNLSKFQGFGFKPAAGSGPRPTQASAGAGTKTSKASPTGGVAALFRSSLEENDHKKAASAPSWSKPTIEAKQAQRQAEAMQAQDPTVFQYDEVIDDIKQDLDVEGPSQLVRTDALEQRKRVGLTVLRGADAVKTGTKRQSKYIEKVIVATDRRKVEQQIIEDRALKKEKDQRQDAEVFVTDAFKQELKRRKKFEEELEMQEMRDTMKAAERQEDGLGFADMYRNLLNGGLASSRGGERVREQAAPRVELPEGEVKQDVSKEVKEEEVKAGAAVKEDVKEEGGSSSSHGVQDVAPVSAAGAAEAPLPKKEREAKENAERQEKAMSARERYLARRRAEAAQA